MLSLDLHLLLVPCSTLTPPWYSAPPCPCCSGRKYSHMECVLDSATGLPTWRYKPGDVFPECCQLINPTNATLGIEEVDPAARMGTRANVQCAAGLVRAGRRSLGCRADPR